MTSRSFLNITAGIGACMVGALCGALTYQSMVLPGYVGVALTGRVDTGIAAVGKRLDERDKQVGQVLNNVNQFVAKADGQITKIRTDVMDRVDRINSNVNGIATMTVDLADRHLTTLEGTIQDVASTAEPLKASLEQVNTQILPVLSDCENNPSCFENRWIGLTRDTEMTLRQIEAASKSVPPTMKSVERAADHSAETMGHVAGISQDVHKVADELTGPKPWYKRLWGGVKVVAGVGSLVK